MNPTIRSRFALASLVSLLTAQALRAEGTDWTSVSDFRSAAGTIVAILILVAFVGAVILWYVGSLTKESNPAQSKWCFQAAWMVAIGLPTISLLFYIFVGKEAVVSPKF